MSALSSSPLSLDDPALLPFLPMLYVAWSDGDLSDEEVGTICRRLAGDCRSILGPWLDPARPPSAEDLDRLLRKIRAKASGLDRRKKLTLSGLGLELAQAGDHHVSAEERSALEDIEGALGIAGTEAARQLLATRRAAVPPPLAQPSFDVPALQAFLDGDQRELRQEVRRLLENPVLRPPQEADRPAFRQWTLEACQFLARQGVGALSFPKDSGGRDDVGAFIAAFETLAYGDLSVVIKAGVQFGLFGGSILNLGTERHHRRYLQSVGTLELPGCFAMTETSHGSNVQDLETVARYDAENEEFVLHTPHRGAFKNYIGNAAQHGRLATVFAQLEVGEASHGVHALLVPIRDENDQPLPGVTIEDCGKKVGLNGVDNGRLGFDQVRVPRENLLDRFATVSAEGTYESPIASPSKRFFTMLGTLVGGRVTIALAGLSVAKSALAVAVRYGAQRRQFGPADEPERLLLDYQTHQRRLLPRLAKTYALHFALDDLRQRFAAAGPDDDRRELEAHAAGLKAYATWHATDTVQTCRECCGGQGYLAENRFADLKADSEVFTTFEGDNIVLLQLVAKGLLSGYKRQFHRMGFFDLLRYLADRAATDLMALNPLSTRRTDPSHLLDHDFHHAAFTWREQHRVSSVARRLKRRLDRGLEISEALVECQNHLVEAALAHVERWVLEQFSSAVKRCETPDQRAVLDRLLTVFAITSLEEDRGWFLEHGYFDPPKARALRKLLDELCLEIRPQAVPLVNAFGIPDTVLAAPIAL